MGDPTATSSAASLPTPESLSLDAFRRLRPAWNALLLSTARPLPFMTHEWICRLQDHFGDDQEFVALVLRDGDKLVAGVPVVVRQVRFLGLSRTVAELAGTGPAPTRGMGLADKVDLLIRTDAPEGTRVQLAAELLKMLDSVDLLDIKGVDSGSETGPALTALAPRPRSTRDMRRSVSPYLELPGSWEAYLTSRSRKFRKNLRRYRRNLGQSGEIEIARMERGADVAGRLREIFAVNERSWTAARGTNLFRSPELRAFFLDVIPDLAEQGWIELQTLRLDGKAIAYELGFDLGDRVFAYSASYDQAHRQHSPGTVISAAIIERACDQGRVEYDMLRGDEGYKLHWSNSYRTERQFLIPGPRAGSALYATLGPYLKNRLKRLRWLDQLDDRLSGAIGRLRYRKSGSS